MKPRTVLLGVALIAACAAAIRANSFSFVHSWISPVMRAVMRDEFTLPYPAPPSPDEWRTLRAADRLANVQSRLLPKLPEELAAHGLKLGQPAFIRVFKESSELELWLQDGGGQWKLFRTYPIACFSGALGPKTREGDMQAPEGFYSVARSQLNPASSYHLAFNIGYPNDYDRQHERTGSLIMVHGDVCSVGCFAMTDAVIEEIYTVVEAALEGGAASVAVHAFPFRMTVARMQRAVEENSLHLEFWRSLQTAHDWFESRQQVPLVRLRDGQYAVED